MTRLQTHTTQGKSIDLPVLGLAAQLVDYLLDAGPVAYTPMGMHPLAWSDIDAWQRVTGVELQTWEARGLRRLSIEYLASAQAAQEPNCPPPYAAEPQPDLRAQISAEIKSIFGAFTRGK